MSRHRGVALVTVLLIVAIASLSATALLSSSSLAIHRTAALRDTEQAWWLAFSGQSLALAVLKEDQARTKLDGLNEPWSKPVDYPVDQGGIRGQIVDQQGLLNLNNLDSADPQVRQAAGNQFTWLTTKVLGIDNGPDLLAAIRDWMDANDVPLPGGAEDSAYAGLDPPYRTGNRRFAAASELLAVQGVTPEIYRKLRPLVTALPKDTKINPNTAPEQVLMALCVQPNPANLETFIKVRAQDPSTAGNGPAQDEDDFVRRNTCDPPATDLRNTVVVKSDYFKVEGEAFIGSSRVALYSLIDRTQTSPRVLSFSTDGD